MPRASWRGFLRLSLVSCPIYLSPAATRTKPIRLHQVWQPAPADVDEEDLPDRGDEQQGSEQSATRLRADSAAPDGEQSPAATRITLRPHDPGTGEEIEKRDVVKGYEYSRGQFWRHQRQRAEHVGPNQRTPPGDPGSELVPDDRVARTVPQ